MRVIALTAVATLMASCGDGQQAVAGPTGGTAAQPAGRADQVSGQQKFRDWLAVCDNVGTCNALGPASEGTGWVRISMAAGPEARPEVAVGFWPDSGADMTDIVTVTVDGEAFEARQETGDSAPPAAVVPSDRAAALTQAMAQGTSMSLRSGEEAVSMSLTGAAAALLWIDERQGRLNTTVALMRKGSRPASSVPAAPAPPRIEPAPGVSQAGYGDQDGQTLPAAIEALPAVVQCRADTAHNPDMQAVISSARLDANTVLWSVPCGSGAYNSADAWFTATPQGTNPRQILFPRASGEPYDLLTNAGYDPTTREMHAFNKGRGLGDCGLADSWTWTAQGFVLKASSEMSECWATPMEYWPTNWVTE